MNRLIITDNTVEKLIIQHDKERYALVHFDRKGFRETPIILNPKEGEAVKNFINENPIYYPEKEMKGD